MVGSSIGLFEVGVLVALESPRAEADVLGTSTPVCRDERGIEIGCKHRNRRIVPPDLIMKEAVLLIADGEEHKLVYALMISKHKTHLNFSPVRL